MVSKVLAGLVMGVVAGIFGYMDVGLASGGGAEAVGPGFWGFAIVGVIVLIIAVRSAGAARAWGWGLLVSGLLSFLLPVTTIVMTGVRMAGQHDAATQVGMAMGGGIATVATGFIGFIIGIVLVIPAIVLILKGKPGAS